MLQHYRKKLLPWFDAKNFNDMESSVFIPIQNENRFQITVSSYGIAPLSLTDCLNCNRRWLLSWEYFKGQYKWMRGRAQQLMMPLISKQQCYQLANKQGTNSCFLKGERGLAKRDMRSPSWSILNQQVRWESLLWSEELHLPPEVLTGLELRLARCRPDTHTAGGLQPDPSTQAACAFYSHTEPVVSLLTQGNLSKSCRKLPAGKQGV